MPRICEFYGISIYMSYRDHAPPHFHAIYGEHEAIMILRIFKAEACGPWSLRLAFNDGTSKTVNVFPLLQGPVFEPLLDPKYFARVTIDPVCGTVVWPNGADFAPEALHELPAVQEPPVAAAGKAKETRTTD